jgi:quercetin dioxygenase-like cupin family protein
MRLTDDSTHVATMNGSAGDADRRLDFHPAMGMRWEITRTTEETSGELFESTNWLDARLQGPPVHMHPNADESFEVIEGSFEVFKNGTWTTLSPGETATFTAGVPHTFRNAGDEPAKIVTRIRPAGRSEAFFRDIHRGIHSGKVKRLPPNGPRAAIYAALLYERYPDEIRPTGALKVVFKALALVGKALRFEL